MAGKKNYRLFQVAKELNVGTALLVDHLQEKGHEVANRPNTKLTPDLYEVLLKKFASEKLIKERAKEQQDEKEVVEENEATLDNKTVEKEDPGPSANDLREQINQNPLGQPKKRRRRSRSSETPTDISELKAPVVKEEKVVPEKKENTPGLKVVGKVDLDSINKSSRRNNKTEAKSAPEKKTAPPEKKAPPLKQEKPVAKKVEPKVETPKVPEKKATPQTQEVKPPVKKTEAKPPVVKPVAKAPENKTEDKEGDEPKKLITAEERAPSLRGLKVMGKIELPSDRKKRKAKEEKNKKAEENKAQNQTKAPAKDGQKSNDADGDAKKKRRRRKRKRKPSEGGDNRGQNTNNRGGNQGGNKKEKPSKKEVDESIRSTLSQLNKGPSRNRQRARRARRDAAAERRELAEMAAAEEEKLLEITEFITANEFANLINVPVNEIITKSFSLGMMVSINQRLDAELLALLAEEYGYEVNFIDVTEKEIEIVEEEDDPADLEGRNPIITVMGHVDHGKTTLLDRLRNANVAAGEAGGITQHIGAYQVQVEEDKKITFIDTPGHEAFTAMRARGAKVTDVAIIVIAADDAVMPQTREAINHAQAAEVPMVFALNKIDKPGANPDRIRTQLSEMNILVEDWGGKFQCQEISALKGDNVEDLLEKVIFEAEVLELQANPDRSSVGTIIEARLDRGRGNVATLLVQNGTLKIGDEMVAGIHYGKVRALIDQKGNRVKEAGPSMPVQVLGLTGQPTAGDKFYVFKEDGKAKDIAKRRHELFREQQLRKNNRLTLEEIGRRKALGNFEELNVIIRADVDGSVEALSGALMKLSTEEVQVNIIWKAVGAISEADINLAIASEAIVMAFNVRPNASARSLADREEVDIRTYSVIYDAINDVRDALEGLLSPEIREEELGTAEIKEVFKITNVGNVAGAFVTTGKLERNTPIRLIRDGVVIYPKKEGVIGRLGSLKRFKDDVKDVVAGFECGFTIENFEDLQAGDVVEAYRINEIKRKLSS
ncbi:MAG: translation initiation factor IF-2 [Bacteroidota bacterium]